MTMPYHEWLETDEAKSRILVWRFFNEPNSCANCSHIKALGQNDYWYVCTIREVNHQNVFAAGDAVCPDHDR